MTSLQKAAIEELFEKLDNIHPDDLEYLRHGNDDELRDELLKRGDKNLRKARKLTQALLESLNYDRTRKT